MPSDQLLAMARARVLRELEGFTVLSLCLCLNEGPDRSVLAIARLGDGCAMVARVYEADIDCRAAIQPTYLSGEDALTLVEALSRPVAEREPAAP